MCHYSKNKGEKLTQFDERCLYRHQCEIVKEARQMSDQRVIRVRIKEAYCGDGGIYCGHRYTGTERGMRKVLLLTSNPARSPCRISGVFSNYYIDSFFDAAKIVPGDKVEFIYNVAKKPKKDECFQVVTEIRFERNSDPSELLKNLPRNLNEIPITLDFDGALIPYSCDCFD